MRNHLSPVQNDKAEKLIELILLSLDGDITLAEMREMNGLLQDAALLQYYVEYIGMHVNLRKALDEIETEGGYWNQALATESTD